jgi:uroporphyrinogen decarboxylase
MKDDLTPRQRKIAFREGKDIDRLPTWFYPHEYCGNLIGLTMREFYTDPAKQAAAILAAVDRWDLDIVQTGVPLGVDLGAKREFPENDYPRVVKTIEGSVQEIESWVAADPKGNPQAKAAWDIFDDLYSKLVVTEKSEIAVMVGMPFTMAATAIGVEKFLKKLIRDPEYIHLIVGKATDLVVESVQALKGYDVLTWVADPVASGSMLRRDQYRTFAQPYQTRVLNALAEVIPNNDHCLHMCGNTTKIWEDMADAGAKLINIDETIDFADASRRVGDRLHLVGNVAPMTMLIGSEEDVIEDLKRSIRESYGRKYLPIIGFADGPPLASKIENFDTLFANFRTYTKYPVNVQAL